MATRNDKFTAKNRQLIYYTSMASTFSLNPQTASLAKVYNEQSVIQSIRNLVLTNKFERPYQPNVGSKVQSLNFEMNDPIQLSLLQTTILETIQAFEPRAQEIDLDIQQDIDNNTISLTIQFKILNIEQPIVFTVLLPRVR